MTAEVEAEIVTHGHKQRLTRGQRMMRLVGGVLDPRAWMHGLRLIGYYNMLHVQPRRQLRVGSGVQISPRTIFNHADLIEIGARVHLNTGCALWAGPTRGRIVLGDDVLFGPDVFVITSNYRFNDGAPVNDQAMDEADVIIGKDVWVGTKSVILPGAQIGDGAIIAAGSMVRGQIPAGAIAGGNPAVVIGWRRGPGGIGDQVTGLMSDPNPVVEALVRRELPDSLPQSRFEGRVEDSGIDSFDLITLRTAIETATGLTIPDREWAGCPRLADIARLPALAKAGMRGDVMPEKARAETVFISAPPVAAPMSDDLLPVGQLRRQLGLNMPQMALSGLSESWLFKELGDMHWAMITRFLQSPSSRITDTEGERLYATFTRLQIEVGPSLRGFRENDALTIDSRLDRYGASFFMGEHVLSGGTDGAEVRARTMSTFAKHGERGKNTSLVKGAPHLPDPDAIPSLAEFPEFGKAYRDRRAVEPEGNLFECDYDILPPHDINGVGLLYFAAYPTIFDLCLERFEGKGFLTRHSTRMKDIFYFANSEPDEVLRFRLHAREARDGVLRHTVSLYRSSDGKRMAEAVIEKVENRL